MKRALLFLPGLICLVSVLNGCGGGSSTPSPSSPATPTITWPTPAAITYGTALGTTQLNATANYPGTFAYTPAAGTVLGAGSHSLSVSFTPTDPSKVLSGTATNSITVNKAMPTITWNTPAAVAVGTALSAAQLNATASFGGASVPGTFAYSPAAGTVMSAGGSKALSATFTPTDATNYNSSNATVSLSVTGGTPPAYSFTNVKILAGGYIPGVYFHPTQQNQGRGTRWATAWPSWSRRAMGGRACYVAASMSEIGIFRQRRISPCSSSHLSAIIPGQNPPSVQEEL